MPSSLKRVRDNIQRGECSNGLHTVYCKVQCCTSVYSKKSIYYSELNILQMKNDDDSNMYRNGKMYFITDRPKAGVPLAMLSTSIASNPGRN